MAVGLGLLGRGGTRPVLGLWALHVAGAALAGALLGGLVGGIGALAGLAAWRPWVIGAAALLAFGLGLLPRPPKMG
jgi:thiol:disulfide interchange protein